MEATRNLEIENIVLREALEDCGVDTSSQEGDMVVRVEKGPSGYFITHAKAEATEDWNLWFNWRDGFPKSNSNIIAHPRQEVTPDVAEQDNVSPVDAWLGEALEALCRQDPERAFDLAVESLGRSAAMMDEIVQETKRDLIEIEIRRKRIDRTQARTREVLSELFGESK